VGIIIFNFSIIQIRTLHAKNKEKYVTYSLLVMLGFYLLFVSFLARLNHPHLLPYVQTAIFLIINFIFYKKIKAND
jgi:hypothetical protein